MTERPKYPRIYSTSSSYISIYSTKPYRCQRGCLSCWSYIGCVVLAVLFQIFSFYALTISDSFSVVWYLAGRGGGRCEEVDGG